MILTLLNHSIYDVNTHWNNKGHEKNFNKILELV